MELPFADGSTARADLVIVADTFWIQRHDAEAALAEQPAA